MVKLLAIALLAISASHAGTLVVGGDINTFDTLPGGLQPLDADFFDNLLGAGTQVLVRTGHSTYAGLANSFYDAKPGVTSSIVSAFTAGNLAGIDLIIAPTPPSYNAGEAAAIADFLASGGTAYLTGEHNLGSFDSHNAALAGLLAAIGSSMTLVPGAILCGPAQTATGAQIAAHPLMSGVGSMTWGCTSTITGGTPLLYLPDLSAVMLAVEGFAETGVPEPACLVAPGLIWILARRRSGIGSFAAARARGQDRAPAHRSNDGA